MARKDHQIFFNDPSRTKQSFKDETDINHLMAKYAKTGLIEHVNKYQGQYGDLSLVQGYHASLNQILAADAAFNSLPSAIRSKFDNDPGKFLAFADNPDNEDEMIELGLRQPPPPPPDAHLAVPIPPAPVEGAATSPADAPAAPPAATPAV